MEINRQASTTNAAWKICNLMVTFAKRYGDADGSRILIREKISQQSIANLLALNRITTFRVMKDLKDQRLIEQVDGYYCILDMDGLRRHMEYLEMDF